VLFERRFQRASELEQENVELKEAVKRLNQQVCDLKHQLGAKRPRAPPPAPALAQHRPADEAPLPLDFSHKRAHPRC